MMKNSEKIEDFLAQVSTTREDYELADCLKAWEVGSSEWNEIMMSLFEIELLYPLSQVVEYIRRGRQVDDYIDLISLLKEPEMVKKEEIFYYLRNFREIDEGAVQRVLCRIYKENEVWDTLDSAIKSNNLRLFEEQVGGDDRLLELKKITCHYQSIMDNQVPLYCNYDSQNLVECNSSEPISSSLEDQKSIVKEILSFCTKLMLTTQEESLIKQICKNPIIEKNLSYEPLRYYYRIREKKATIPKKVEEQPVESHTYLQEYWTKQEAINLLKVSPGTLYNWENKEKLIPHRIERKVYYLKSDVEKAMKKKAL